MSRTMSRPLRVAVIGPNVASPEVLGAAERVGRGIAERGGVLYCGGRGGAMQAACRGAKAAGGLTVGVLPGEDAAEANHFVDVPIVTGMREARNVILVRSAEVVIAIAGAYGTLTEIAFALHLGRPVVGLGTWTLTPGEGGPDAITRAETAEEAVRAAFRLVGGPR